MADDFQKGVMKTIDITVQTAKITDDILKQAMRQFLTGNAEKTGKMSLRQLENKSQGKLESIEITENNIKDFLSTAKKYDIDFSLKKDKSTEPPTYHVFFQSGKADNFNRAFSEYADKKADQIEKQKAPFNREKLKERANDIANQPRKKKEKVRERNKENSL